MEVILEFFLGEMTKKNKYQTKNIFRKKKFFKLKKYFQIISKNGKK